MLSWRNQHGCDAELALITCSVLTLLSESLNSYRMFQPSGPNFLRSWTVERRGAPSAGRKEAAWWR